MKRWIIFFVVLAALIGCKEPQIAPTYDFSYAFEQMMEIDASYNTSFFNETMLTPLDTDTIEQLLQEYRLMRRNNEQMNISADYKDIGLLLDSRENLLMAQRNYQLFNDTFIGKGICSDASSDLVALNYLDLAIDQGIRTSSRLDKLITESDKARNIILNMSRPATYDINYGELTKLARLYRGYMYEYCKSSITNECTV